jgi:hypothetical protein
MRTMLLAAAAALAFGTAANALPVCTTGQLCGNSCIPKTSVCNITPPPAGATGQCNDGTWTMAKNHQGACSGHGGVKRWL